MNMNVLKRLALPLFATMALFSATGCENPSAVQSNDEQLIGVQSSPFGNNAGGESDTKIPGQYIVTFKQSVSNPKAVAQGLANAHGGDVLYTYTTAIKGFTLRVPEQAAENVVAALQNNPNIERI